MKYLKYGFILLSVFLFIGSVQAERIKDIASIEGMRNNQLVGYGLVLPPGVVPQSQVMLEKYQVQLVK